MGADEPGDAGRLTSWTLGAVKARNLALEGYCQTEGCGHFYTFSVDDLIASAGPTTSCPKFCPAWNVQRAVAS